MAEAFNKTLVKLLKKILSKNKREWHDKLTEALWAYRTTYKTAMQATSYSLVFGTKAILPLEVELPSLRIAVLTKEENDFLRLEELEALDEVTKFRILQSKNN